MLLLTIDILPEICYISIRKRERETHSSKRTTRSRLTPRSLPQANKRPGGWKRFA